MTREMKMMLEALDASKAQIDAVRPLPKHTVASLRDKLHLEWTYHSNAIEGNTLTLRETKVVLEGITVGGRSLVEHLEAINHREAINYVEGIVADQEDLSEWQIKNIHALVLKGIDGEGAGKYRRENVVISGASITPPDYLLVEDKMREMMTWYEKAKQLHPVERAAKLHTIFVKVHPFVDGNGRTGRLLMNFELMKFGYPPAILRKEDRLDYYNALDEACSTGSYDKITKMIGGAVQRSLDTYVSLVQPGVKHNVVNDASPEPDMKP